MLSNEEYRAERTALSQFLRSTTGQTLMKRLHESWNPMSLQGGSPEETAYRIGKRDAYYELIELQDYQP